MREKGREETNRASLARGVGSSSAEKSATLGFFFFAPTAGFFRFGVEISSSRLSSVSSFSSSSIKAANRSTSLFSPSLSFKSFLFLFALYPLASAALSAPLIPA